MDSSSKSVVAQLRNSKCERTLEVKPCLTLSNTTMPPKKQGVTTCTSNAIKHPGAIQEEGKCKRRTAKEITTEEMMKRTAKDKVQQKHQLALGCIALLENQLAAEDTQLKVSCLGTSCQPKQSVNQKRTTPSSVDEADKSSKSDFQPPSDSDDDDNDLPEDLEKTVKIDKEELLDPYLQPPKKRAKIPASDNVCGGTLCCSC